MKFLRNKMEQIDMESFTFSDTYIKMYDCTEEVLRGEYDLPKRAGGVTVDTDADNADADSNADSSGDADDDTDDYSDDDRDGPDEAEAEDGDDDFAESHIVVDLIALKQRPKLKEAILDCLDPNRKHPISDELLLEMINTFPDVRQEFNKLFYSLHEFDEREGNPTYYPSILDVTDAEEILKINQLGGFREMHDELPHKYAHLSKKSIDIIYGNPRIRSVVSRMTADKITDDLVASMAG